MIQELMARSLNLELGSYFHFVGSLHIYHEDLEKIETYLEEGWPESKPMPAMPPDNPLDYMPEIVSIEREIRISNKLELGTTKFDAYWSDIFKLLHIFRLYKNQDKSSLEQARAIEKTIEDVSAVYSQYTKKLLDKFEEKL